MYSPVCLSICLLINIWIAWSQIAEEDAPQRGGAWLRQSSVVIFLLSCGLRRTRVTNKYGHVGKPAYSRTDRSACILKVCSMKWSCLSTPTCPLTAELPTSQNFHKNFQSHSHRERDWKSRFDLLRDYERGFMEYELTCLKTLGRLEFY